MKSNMRIVLLAALCSRAWSYEYPTHGAVSTLDQSCLNDLDNIFNDYYLLTSTTLSQDNRTNPWFLNAQRRLGCRLSILEALESPTANGCPTEQQLVDCFWVAAKNWSALVHKCELFESQIPLPACSDAPGEAAEGVPSCSAQQNTALTDSATTGRRRLQQGGPVNNIGIATWQYSNGEAAGLQYDAYAPTGSPVAQPPLAANLQGVTGVDAAALGALNEGNEGASVSSSKTVVSASGCFPSFWTAQDFEQWLNGTFVEEARPKDYGGVNVIGLVSVWIYTLLLCSLAMF